MAPTKVKKKKRQRPAEESPDEASLVNKAATELPVVPAKRKKKKKLKRKAVAELPVEPIKSEVPVAEPPPRKKRKKKTGDSSGGEPKPMAPTKDDALDKVFQKKKESLPPLFEKKVSQDTTVFVDGLPYQWNVSMVEDHFQVCGKVKEVRAPTWQDSGRLRGFAHVTFADQAGRDKALTMDGSKVGDKGRYLKIEPAKAPESVESPDASEMEGKRRLFVKNLPYDATEKHIGELFAKCGKINEVRVPTSFGRSKGFAYVEFARAEYLKAAVEMQPPPSLQGRTLRLDVDIGKGPKAGFHHRPEAFDSGFGPRRTGGKGSDGKDSGKDGGKGKGKGKDKGKDKGKGKGKDSGFKKKLSLFGD